MFWGVYLVFGIYKNLPAQSDNKIELREAAVGIEAK
jgi:hypothetical protein